MSAKYELKTASNGKFMFNLIAGNGEVILTSDLYEAKDGAQKGIESVRAHCAADENYERTDSEAGQPYFLLKAANHEIIGRSQMYSSTSSRDNGIESVKTNGADARVEEETQG